MAEVDSNGSVSSRTRTLNYKPYCLQTHGSKSLPVCELLKSSDLIPQTHTGTLALLGAMDWTVSPSPNSYVDAITPNVTTFGDRAFRR